MKKINFIFLFIISLFIIGITNANATSKCTVVNGNGKNIGDEIKCGTENFYIISNDGKEVEMMAKYNLYVGRVYNKIVLDINKTYVKKECSSSTSCYGSETYYYEGEKVSSWSDWWSKIKEDNNIKNYYYNRYTIYGDIYEENGTYYQNFTYKLYPYSVLTSTTSVFNMQNSTAIGVTGEKGNATYPMVGVLPLMDPDYSDYLEDHVEDVSTPYSDGYTDITSFKDGTDITDYLETYKNNMKYLGFTIDSIDLPTISKLNEITKNVTGKNLPLKEWYNDNDDQIEVEENDTYSYKDENDYIYFNGDLKESIPEKYSWIWSTSYWTKTLYGEWDSEDISEYYTGSTYAYFVTAKGEVCNMSVEDCSSSVIPRAGIRPILTMNANQVYNVYTKDDGNGTVSYESVNGVVHFTLTPKDGYVLGVVKVTDANGNTIKFTNNEFDMPSADVTIEATFTKIENPNTKSFITTTVSIMLLTLTIIIFSYKKVNKYN